MASYVYAIRLTSDAEPGTGLGGEVVNEFIPRNQQGNWLIYASHVKGLMKQAVIDLIGALAVDDEESWNDDVLDRTFGKGDAFESGIEAAFRLTDAVATDQSDTKLVSRTALETETRTAKETSLRTTEAVPVGTVFQGTLHTSATPDSVEDLAWQFALTAVAAVGGSRSRGCGACIVEFEPQPASGGQTQKDATTQTMQTTPGQLLCRLSEALRAGNWSKHREPHVDAAPATGLSAETVVLRITFFADTPICCPELPDKTNVIKSGFSIPASAVQGLILHRINDQNPSLASQLFHDRRFRAWPLQPGRHPEDATTRTQNLVSSIRVSLTHRVAKYSVPDVYGPDHFWDEAIQPCPWDQAPNGAPLKASDGVLLRWKAEKDSFADGIELWRATDMPHAITSHGVHNDPETGRNLFTVDAMAPLIWQGLVVLPRDTAEALQKSLAQNAIVAVGKSRSVRGMGRLEAEIVEGIPPHWQTNQNTDRTILVVQSPLLLPMSGSSNERADERFVEMANAWAQHHNLPPLAQDKGTWTNVGIRFGWSRLKNGREQAQRVVLPGSVVVFSEPVENAALLAKALQAGFFDPVADAEDAGRARGYGAVCVHPGKARDLYAVDRKTVSKTSSFQNELQLVLEMRRAGPLPSPSQIRAVQQRLDTDSPDAAQQTKAYLKRQLERTSRIWYTWEPIHQKMEQLLDSADREAASRALAVLANCAVVEGREKNT